MAVFLSIKIGILPYIRFFKIPELKDLITQGNFQIIETEILSQSPATEYFIAAKKI